MIRRPRPGEDDLDQMMREFEVQQKADQAARQTKILPEIFYISLRELYFVYTGMLCVLRMID